MILVLMPPVLSWSSNVGAFEEPLPHQPSKVLAQLVPRELSVEHSGSIIGRLSDEQLAAMVSELDRQMAELAKRAAGEDAKLIDTKAEQTPERGAATLGWRKPNPKTPPHELAQARLGD